MDVDSSGTQQTAAPTVGSGSLGGGGSSVGSALSSSNSTHLSSSSSSNSNSNRQGKSSASGSSSGRLQHQSHRAGSLEPGGSGTGSASGSGRLIRQSPGSGINNAEILGHRISAADSRGGSGSGSGGSQSDPNLQVLPALFDDAKAEDVVVLVADMLSRLVAHNDKLPLHPSSLTRFHSRATPGISIASYLRRIVRYTNLEKVCTLILLVYIDRVCERMPGFTICGLTVHRFVCAAIVCASKALCDAFSTNSHYAKVGGISLIELNMLEKEFLENIDWTLTCDGALLQHYYSSLVRSHPAYTLAEEPMSTSSVSSSTNDISMSPANNSIGSSSHKDSPQLAPVPGYDDPFLSARMRESEYPDLNVAVPGHRWPRPEDRKAQQRADGDS